MVAAAAAWFIACLYKIDMVLQRIVEPDPYESTA
jgi:hypothetical protein